MKIDIKNLIGLTKTLNVLYAEDNPVASKHTLLLFEEFFAHVDAVFDGQSGFDKFLNDKNRYDIIITDIDMPVMNGIAMSSEIRKESLDIPIVILSAYSDTNYFIDTIKIGIDGYLLKPINIDQFTQTIKKIVDKIELKRENLSYQRILEKRVKKQVDIIRDKDIMLFKQSKLAAMGEMIDAVAHQWKQPLSVVKMACEIEAFLENDFLPMDIAKKNSTLVKSQIEYLIETIDEFRKFLRPDFRLERVNIKDIINSVTTLLKDELIKHQIQIVYDNSHESYINIVPNEFKHILINLIHNSKDAFISNDIKKREIVIEVKEDELMHIIDVKDNAGGIEAKILDDVFSPDISTKGENGTGIGLYICKQIIQKIGGDIEAKNISNGAMFTIKVPK